VSNLPIKYKRKRKKLMMLLLLFPKFRKKSKVCIFIDVGAIYKKLLPTNVVEEFQLKRSILDN